MTAFLAKYKGYIIHGVAVGLVFISPSVQVLIKAHPDYALALSAVWGWVLHWATGK